MLFGRPRRYAWGSQTYDANDLPDSYIMDYAEGFNVFIRADRIEEVRFGRVDLGYAFRDTVRIGSTLDDVLKVLGPPAETVTGEKIGWQDGVLYRDVEGMRSRGYCTCRPGDSRVPRGRPRSRPVHHSDLSACLRLKHTTRSSTEERRGSLVSAFRSWCVCLCGMTHGCRRPHAWRDRMDALLFSIVAPETGLTRFVRQ